MYLKLARQCGFRTEHGIEIRESQINLTCTPTCLCVPRLHPVLIYPQVTGWPSALFLLGTRKESAIYWTANSSFALYLWNNFAELQRIIRCWFLVKETSGRDFSAQSISSHYQTVTMPSLTAAPFTALHGMHNGWHCQALFPDVV